MGACSMGRRSNYSSLAILNILAAQSSEGKMNNMMLGATSYYVQFG